MTPNEHALEAEKLLAGYLDAPEDYGPNYELLLMAATQALVALALQQTGWTTTSE